MSRGVGAEHLLRSRLITGCWDATRDATRDGNETREEAGEYDWRGTCVVPEDGDVNAVLVAAESVGAAIERAPTGTETKLTV